MRRYTVAPEHGRLSPDEPEASIGMSRVTHSMHGKTVLITGGTGGIGRAAAIGLASMGARVGITGRDRDRAGRAAAAIAQESGNPAVDVFVADMSSQTEVRRLAREVISAYPRLDVLVNNAGVFRSERITTADGLETTFAVNHLAYFLLTNLLLDSLEAGAPSRIVNVASADHSNATIAFDDLQGEKGYRGAKAYSQSKLANVLFTHELARRLRGTGVTATCLHPGVVGTNLGSGVSGAFGFVVRALRPFMKSPAKGAETSIYLASSPEVEGSSGRYFVTKAEARSSDVSYDERLARRLWEASAELTNLPVQNR